MRRGLKKPIEEWTATGKLVSSLLVAACDTAVPTEILKLLLAARPPDDFSCLHPPGYADMDNGTATVRSQSLSPSASNQIHCLISVDHRLICDVGSLQIPLLAAIKADNAAAVDMLLEAGASIYYPLLYSPLHYAVYSGTPKATLERMMRSNPSRILAGFNPRPDQRLGLWGNWNLHFEKSTPLLEACASGNLDAMDVFLAWRDPHTGDPVRINQVRPHCRATVTIAIAITVFMTTVEQLNRPCVVCVVCGVCGVCGFGGCSKLVMTSCCGSLWRASSSTCSRPRPRPTRPSRRRGTSACGRCCALCSPWAPTPTSRYVVTPPPPPRSLPPDSVALTAAVGDSWAGKCCWRGSCGSRCFSRPRNSLTSSSGSFWVHTHTRTHAHTHTRTHAHTHTRTHARNVSLSPPLPSPPTRSLVGTQTEHKALATQPENKSGDSPMHVAAREERHLNAMRLLLQPDISTTAAHAHIHHPHQLRVCR